MTKKMLSILLILCVFCEFSVMSFAAEDDFALPDLVSQIPLCASSGKTETILTVDHGPAEIFGSVTAILFNGLMRDGLLKGTVPRFSSPPTEEQMKECPNVSAEDLKKTYVRLFGPDALTVYGDLRESYAIYGYQVLTRLKDGSYAYYYYSYGGGDLNVSRRSYLRSETEGDNLIVYTTFAEMPPVGDRIFRLRGAYSSTEYLINLDQKEFSNLPAGVDPWVMAYEGRFDEYLPVYKNTFKPNGDGTYYWAKTEPFSEGKEIPLSVFDAEADYLKSLMATVPELGYGDSTASSHAMLTGSRLLDGILTVNEAYVEWTVEGDSLILSSPGGIGKDGKRVILGTWDDLDEEDLKKVEEQILNGTFSEYYMKVRHKFKKNAEGAFVYEESTLFSEGIEIPASLLGSVITSGNGEELTSPGESSGTVQESSDKTTETVGSEIATDNGETTAPVTDIPTTTDNGETTAPATDTPAPSDSSVPTEGAAEEASFPWVWVCIGGGVVIVALGAILFFKKKKI